MAPGKPVILATPDGVGLCGNDPVTLDYAMTNYMVVARYRVSPLSPGPSPLISDGVWDFVDDSTVVDLVLSRAVCAPFANLGSHAPQGKKSEDEIASELLDVSRQNGSEDDVTIIVLQITYDLS